MRFERVKEKQVIRNKVNQGIYTVISVENGSAVLAPYDEEFEAPVLEPAQYVTMTEANAIAFGLVNDPNPEVVPAGYSVENGILMKDGEPATTQGQIIVEQILAAMPGYLVLRTSKQGGRHVYVTKYVPKKDPTKNDQFIEIQDIGAFYDEAEVRIVTRPLLNTEDVQVIVYDVTETREEESEEGEKVRKTYFVRSGALMIGDRYTTKEAYDLPVAMITELERELVRLQDEYSTIYAPIWAEVSDETGELTHSDKIVGTLQLQYAEGRMSAVVLGIRDEIISATRYFRGGDFIRTQNAIYIDDSLQAKSDVIEGIPAEYKYLVDISRDDYTTKYSLSTKDYRVITLTKTSTKDRGFIFEAA